MNDDLVPDWIKRIRDKDEADNAEAELSRLRQRTAQNLVQTEGIKFWKQLTKELEIAAHACSRIGITANCTSESNRSEPTQYGVRVNMSAGSPLAKVVHTNIWYTAGDGYIRCITMDSREKIIRLGIGPSGEVCGIGSGGGMMDAEKGAEEILAPLVQYLRT